jgi:hypothetical protein
MPAKVMAGGGSSTKAGAYVPCSGINYFDDNTASYIKDDPRYSWVWASISNATSIPNTVVLKSAKFNYFFARITVTNARGTYTEVGKLHNGPYTFTGLWFTGVNGEENAKDRFEVLVCT